MRVTKLAAGRAPDPAEMRIWIEQAGGKALLIVAEAGGQRQNIGSLKIGEAGLEFEVMAIVPACNPGIRLTAGNFIFITGGPFADAPVAVFLPPVAEAAIAGEAT